MEDADRTGAEEEGSRFDFLFSPAGTATVRVAGMDSGDGTGREADIRTVTVGKVIRRDVGTGAFRLAAAEVSTGM